ncbi:MAG: hypothetical protein JSV77_07165 [Dehalococcoidales bacterium]|nr:MAG: hypothetical protein JSV77_07165 [Dehalococcoidales bacterium]
MAIISMVLGIAGALCGILGMLTMLGALPTFIPLEEAIGPYVATTAFWWGLAGLMLLGSIAISVTQRRTPYD